MTALRNPRLTVVGSINIDLTATVERLPGPGETVGSGVLRRAPGGKGANQATAAARLGADVRLIGAVGDDRDGEWMLTELIQAGVDVDAVRVVDGPTGIALIGVDRAAENQIMVCAGANDRVSLANVHLAAEDTVLTQLEVDLELVRELAVTHSGFLAVNASPAQALPAELVDRVDLFIVNETEYELIPELHGAKRVVVTYGGAGAAVFGHGRELARVPAVAATPVNTVGAGDAFCAAFVLAIRSGMSDEDALRTACAVGAAAVESPASQPDFPTLACFTA